MIMIMSTRTFVNEDWHKIVLCKDGKNHQYHIDKSQSKQRQHASCQQGLLKHRLDRVGLEEKYTWNHETRQGQPNTLVQNKRSFPLSVDNRQNANGKRVPNAQSPVSMQAGDKRSVSKQVRLNQYCSSHGIRWHAPQKPVPRVTQGSVGSCLASFDLSSPFI